MLSRFCLPLLAATLAMPAIGQPTELYEVRHYLLDENGDPAALDQYFRDALLPALERQGIEQVGVYEYPESLNQDVRPNQSVSPRMVVIIPYASANQMAEVKQALGKDPQYQKAGSDYLQRPHDQRAFKRIESELLIAMDCMKQMNVPEGTLDNDERVYEFRLYESANERLGNKKVEMFNNGEVPIFLDSGIQPIFIGQALIGPKQPSLSYLTVYPNDEARRKAWKQFFAHPDWKKLSKDPQYAHTVSRIDKLVLKAKPYSKM